MIIIPIDTAQQEQIIAATENYIYQAGIALDHSFEMVPVLFDLKGRAAGMYKIKNGQRVIRYNPYLFARYYSENLATTVPHEVAHYVVDVLYGTKKTKPHGQEWKTIMALFEADASVTSCYDLGGIPVKNYQQFEYTCACRTHYLTRIRHNRAMNGIRYHCRSCKRKLIISPEIAIL